MALKNFPNDAAIDHAIPPVSAAREDAGEPLRKETNEVLKDIRDATQERFAEVDSDSRWTDARDWSATTITKVDAEEGTSTERKAWTAQRVRQAVVAFFNQATSTFTRALLQRTSATQVRADLELGDSATRSVGTTSGTVAAGNDSRITGALQKADLAGVTGQGTNTALTQKAASDKFASVEGDITALETGLQNKVDKEAGKGLSDENYTAAEKSKLAGLQGSKWKGKFVSLAALQSGVATPTAGDYADVDSGVGSDIKRYIYDADDAKWVEQSGVVADLTGAQIKSLYEAEPDTNAFSDSEASKLAALPSNQTLTGMFAAKVDKETGKGLIEPAPADGKQYARKDDAWVEVTGDVEEAPVDGKQYARKNAAWEEVAADGGDVEEAPTDGKLYGRKDAGWTEVVVEAGILALDFDQEALQLSGRDWPLFDDFPDHTKNYKGYIYNDSEGTFFPYTATFRPSYGGIAEAVTVEVFPDANAPFNFSYITMIVEEYFGPDPVAMPVSSTPFYSVSTSTGLPAGVTSLSILYQIENMRDFSIAGIKVSISAGNKDVPISIDLESITATSSDMFGMPMDFYPQPFTPSFSDSLGHGIMELAVVGITTDDVGYKVRLVDNDLIITSDSDDPHTLGIEIPVTKKGFTWL